jgi:hypothetical protein
MYTPETTKPLINDSVANEGAIMKASHMIADAYGYSLDDHVVPTVTTASYEVATQNLPVACPVFISCFSNHWDGSECTTLNQRSSVSE